MVIFGGEFSHFFGIPIFTPIFALSASKLLQSHDVWWRLLFWVLPLNSAQDQGPFQLKLESIFRREMMDFLAIIPVVKSNR